MCAIRSTDVTPRKQGTIRSVRGVLGTRPNESHPQPKNPADPVERLDRRVALARFDALERQRAQPAMVCELFLRQAADLAHAFDGLPEVQAADRKSTRLNSSH